MYLGDMSNQADNYVGLVARRSKRPAADEGHQRTEPVRVKGGGAARLWLGGGSGGGDGSGSSTSSTNSTSSSSSSSNSNRSNSSRNNRRYSREVRRGASQCEALYYRYYYHHYCHPPLPSPSSERHNPGPMRPCAHILDRFVSLSYSSPLYVYRARARSSECSDISMTSRGRMRGRLWMKLVVCEG